MQTLHRLLIVGCLGGIGVLFSVGFAHAQAYNPYANYYQAQLRQQVLTAQVPSANMYGRNAAQLYQAPIPASQVVDPYLSQGNPYNQTPLGTSLPYLSPYDQGLGYGSPFFGAGFNIAGGALMGQADVMRSYGKVINDQEEARIKRELANQARLETVKKEFDLRMYIKANTPTYTQEQEKIAQTTLRRIQTNSLPGEVSNGKSLNYLLDDLRKFPNKKLSAEPMQLSEAVLVHLNVTKNTFGMGILRDEGRVTWPTALRESMTEKQRKWLDTQLEDLVKEANKGRLDANVLRDVRGEMDKVREDLVKRVNDTPTSQYLDAKRFLHEFNEATIALERGEVAVQAKFQRFVEGGKSVQEVTDYMVQHGLRFGPATANDEAAYRAIHSLLASYNIAMNLGSERKD